MPSPSDWVYIEHPAVGRSPNPVQRGSLAAWFAQGWAESSDQDEQASSEPWIEPVAQCGTGLMIPMYIYPANAYTNTDYNNLIALARTYPRVPCMVILNNSNGPGEAQDLNFTVAIRRMHAAGITVLGYVDTAYTAVTDDTVRAQVDTWLAFYPDVDGVFWDQGTNDTNSTHLAYYRSITDFAHTRGLHPVVLNTGTVIPEDYYAGCADIVVVHENSTYPTEADLKGDFAGGASDYPRTRRGVLVYDKATLDPAAVTMMSKYVRWVYVTNDAAVNPWDSLTTYLDDLFAALDG
jgi:hypothetical protein